VDGLDRRKRGATSDSLATVYETKANRRIAERSRTRQRSQDRLARRARSSDDYLARARATNPANTRLCFRCLVAVSVPRVHDLRAEELPGSEALRAGMVHRQSAGTSPSGSRTQDHDRLLPAALPGAVPRRARLPVPVSISRNVSLSLG